MQNCQLQCEKSNTGLYHRIVQISKRRLQQHTLKSSLLKKRISQAKCNEHTLDEVASTFVKIIFLFEVKETTALQILAQN